jgi:hypothetical protein
VFASVGLAIKFGRESRPSDGPTGPAAAVSTQESLDRRLRASDPKALTTLHERIVSRAGEPSKRTPLTDEEASTWVETLTSLRTGFLKHNTPGRASSILLSAKIFELFSVEPSPAAWSNTLGPLHDILAAGVADSESIVRVSSLGEVAKLWSWIPGRSVVGLEEQALAEWKEGLYRPVVRCLASQDVATRIAAVACLGKLPVDNAAAPAIAYLEDPNSADVRKQTLISFADRPSLLTADDLLKRMHDSDPAIAETAGIVLKARGLSHEQIRLGSLIFSPKPEQRASVLPMLKDRTDIDPVVWILELSRDPVEDVRLQAAGALAAVKSPTIEVTGRLAEMARSDDSERVRQAASKFLPPLEETTAALPPLPGSPSLNPKAN